MKKLLLVLAIGAFVACNDSGKEEPTKTGDSTPATQTPAPDSLTNAVDSNKVDTTKVGGTVDTTKK